MQIVTPNANRQDRGAEPQVGGEVEVHRERDAIGERDRPPRHHDPARPRHQREDEALGHELPHQHAAPGADAQPHGHLAPPILRPRQEQVGDVDARDEQQHQDHRHHHPGQPNLRRAEHGVNPGVLLGDQGDPRALVDAREVDTKLAFQRPHPRASPLHRDPGGESRDQTGRVLVAFAHRLRTERLELRQLHQRNPQLRRDERGRCRETRAGSPR